MYLDSEHKIEELGIKLIDPKTYDFQMGDHVCVYFPKTPSVNYKDFVKIPSMPFGFWHYGVCCGRDDEGKLRFISQNNNGITYEDIQTFSKGCLKWGIVEHDYKKNSRAECLKKAMTAYHCFIKNEYDFKENNCEHFSNRVIEDKNFSKEVEVVQKDLMDIFKDIGAVAAVCIAGVIAGISGKIYLDKKGKK